MSKELTISGAYEVKENMSLTKLVIPEGASLVAPEGKHLTLKVNHAGVAPVPGTYFGDIEILIGDYYEMTPHGLMKAIGKTEYMRGALVVNDNEIDIDKSVIGMFNDGEITEDYANDFTLYSEEEDFNGIILTGTTGFTINNAKMVLEGKGRNDYAGIGAGVTAIDNAKVVINDSDITLNGETRCAIHVGGSAVVEVNDCNIINISPDNKEWMGDFSWGIGVTGTNRLVQLADDGTVYYNGCYMKTNGWGVFSIDGCNDCARVFVKDCVVDLSGPRANGYGGFCIGDRNTVGFEDSEIHVDGYALIVRGMMDGAASSYFTGCEVTGNRFGIISIGDIHTPVLIEDTSFHTGRAVIVTKGSSTEYNIVNSELISDEGVILQLMDNDDPAMNTNAINIEVSPDVYVEGRDLSAFHEGFDVEMNLINDELVGNFFNSTTNCHREKNIITGQPTSSPFGGLFAPPEGEASFLEAPPEDLDIRDEVNYDKEQRGPKNLFINLVSSQVEGQISSASQSYREGLDWIDESLRLELSNVTQEAAPTINNGVVVNVDTDSTWIVTDTCYITGLTIGKHGLVKTYENHELKMTVDGVATPIEQDHTYTGKIVLEIA